ncbi:FtsK/SpoIIIE domain-containing protein [Streptomyces sp. NPDC048340]|uniref:FtsK/SpoIIIE domain-containing protein n=1 Tax=Streptomyces sp. NPDC048340 TaxID=3365537 RepID=UPI003720B18D
MGKKRQEQEEDFYGNTAGAIGGLVMVFGGLMLVKIKTGLPWPVAVLLVVAVLIGLGYAAWKVKTTVQRRWNSKPADAPAPAAALAQEALPADDEPAHPELTRALVRTGAIGKDEIIRLADVRAESLAVGGTRYTFLLPEGGVHESVSKNLGPIGSMLGVTRMHLKLEASRESERKITLLKLDKPPFTHPFDPPTRSEILAFKGAPLGHEVTGEIAGIPTFTGSSMLVAAMTQMGKTTFLVGLLTCLLIASGDEVDMVLVDGKGGADLAPFAPVTIRYEASSDPAVFEKILDEENAEVARRYEIARKAKEARGPAPKFRHRFVVVDEAADLFQHNGRPDSKAMAARIEEKARTLVAKALQSGYTVIMLTQRPEDSAIPVKVRAQFLNRMCLYVDSEGSAKVALGDTYFSTVAPINPVLLNPSIKGHGVLFAGGTSRLIRGFDFPESFIWEVIDETVERRKARIAATPQSPLTQAINLMHAKGVKFVPTADLVEFFAIVEETSSAAGVALSNLLGVPAGKGTGGVRGYKLTDLTEAALSDS